jgi:[acyl-carrier-protein] S-malonyltransferase
MSMRFLILCSGQGGQGPGMFDLARQDPAGLALLERYPAPAAERLFENAVAQPAIVLSALATWAALRYKVPAPDVCAGYSIGELAAHAVAGALTPDAAIALANERAALMDACVNPGAPQGMLAVSQLDTDAVGRMASAHGCAVAILNDVDKCVVGGPAAGLDALAAEAAAAGARCQRLKVNIASHTAWMAPAVRPFAAALEGAHPAHAACPVIAGIDAGRVVEPVQLVDSLSRQLEQPIRWADCMDACAEAGVDVALELGPCNALAAMLRTRHPHIACRSVSEFRTLDGIVAWLARAGA